MCVVFVRVRVCVAIQAFVRYSSRVGPSLPIGSSGTINKSSMNVYCKILEKMKRLQFSLCCCCYIHKTENR